MKEKNAPSLKHPEVLFLSLFGFGFAPKIPGTMGTLATLPLLYGLGKLNFPLLFLLPLFFALTIASCFIVEISQKKFKAHDPSWIVMDEALGMALAWSFSASSHFAHLALLFILFRFFDILKVWPANFFDKKVKHGAGVILDDIISGLYTGIVYKIIQVFFFPSS